MDEMEMRVEKLQTECYRDSTRKSYYGIWKSFNHFILKLDRIPCTWDQRLVLYVAFLIDCGRKSSTIHSYVSAIKALLLEDGIELSEEQYKLTSLIKTCKLKNDKVQTRLPIHKSMLNILLLTTARYFDNAGQLFLGKLYGALFASAYYGLLRVGELTSGTHPVFATDVLIAENKKKIMFTLHSSKMHGHDSKLQIIKIQSIKKAESLNRVKNPLLCPYQLLRNYAAVRPTCHSIFEPFFIFQDRSVVQPHHIRSTLKLMIKLSKFDDTLYDTHSFRIGAASDLLNKGFSVETIKKLGRWKSNSVYVYLR